MIAKTVQIVTQLLCTLMLLTHTFQSIAAEQSKDNLKILFLSSAHSNKAKVKLFTDIAKESTKIDGNTFLWEIAHKSESSVKDLIVAEQLFQQYDFIIFDGVSARESNKAYAKYIPLVAKSNKHFIAINWLEQKKLQQGLSAKQQKNLQAYWQNAGRKNLTNLLTFIALDVFNVRNKSSELLVASPIIFPAKGIYHPKQPNLISKDLDEYYQWQQPKSAQIKVGILMQRALIEIEQTELIDETIEQLEAQGVAVVPFFFKLAAGEKNYQELLQLKQNDVLTTQVDVIISFRNIHWANQRKVEFEHFGVPVIQAMTYYDGDTKAWQDDPQGISAGMMSFTLVLPESAGVTDPMIVAAYNRETNSTEIIDYQLQHLVNKAINLGKLKHKANKDKKITVFVWGDQDVGASFLNVPDSLKTISSKLAAEGYNMQPQSDDFFAERAKRILNPFYRDYQLDELLADDLAELMPIADYLQWFNSLPEKVRTPINEHWGKPQDNFMAIERDGQHYFVLPRIRNGNMLVMRQPPRSDKKDDEDAIYHVGTVPINHFYLAAYYYAREYWQSDAIVHLGTHGSHEYLGGKERGLSMYDQGNLAVWDTPVVYPFIVDDVGEAMQTKRRGRATVISHMTPPFAAAGLQGKIANLHELMHQYKQLDEGGVKHKTAEQIIDVCLKNNICADLSLSKEEIQQDFIAFFERLHSYLEALATSNQPLGLHSFGELAEQRLLTSTLVQMLGSEFSSIAGEFEHQYFITHESITKKKGEKKDQTKHELNDKQHSYHEPVTNNSAKENEVAVADLENLAGFQTIKHYVLLADSDDNQQPVVFDKLPAELQVFVKKAQAFYKDMSEIREHKSLVDFLNGKYIPVKTGGDPIRHPESLATGYNLYGFDPSRVPTKAAFEQGKELVEQMITDYQQKHGKYPEKMAFSLWSIETMRHYGVLESQALYAMGVTPTWSADGRVIGSEIIPYAKLKRPRIDVVLSATGLYRDAFPNVMLRLAKAVEQVAALKEDHNSIWKNSQRIAAELVVKGVLPEEAQYLSTLRVFSNESGDYGSGVNSAAWASDTWQTDKKISDLYLSKMGFGFGSDNSRWGQKATTQTGEPVNLYAQQLSGTDIAMFARSSNLFGMLSSDDPFEYFGALSLAVRNIDGKSPDMVISNLRDASNAKAQDAALFMATELRTRMFHKRWINEMQKEGYAGAVAMSSSIDNFFGWQVVDPNLVRDDQWDEYFDTYVNDKLNIELDTWFEQTNPAALARMMERMLEAERKDYWQTDDDRLKTLVERYIEMVNKYDLIVANDALAENVDKLAQGFGLNQVLKQTSNKIEQVSEQISAQAATDTQVENVEVTGQQLEKQTQHNEVQPQLTLIYALVVLLMIILSGMFFQLWPRNKQQKDA
ncbi:MAG: cobaltochelatase CobN [Alteromonadaceae bacterium]|jgi:cobaltochelatase CobN